MKPLDYIASLTTGIIERKRINDMRNSVRKAIDSTTPSYQSAAEFFSEARFASKEANDFQTVFHKRIQTKFRGNWVQVMHLTLLQAEKHYDKLTKHIDRDFNGDIPKEALTFYKVAVLQHLEAISFLASYCNRLMIWLYDVETRACKVNNALRTLPKGEINWLVEKQDAFLHVVNQFQQSAEEMDRSITKTPDMLVNERTTETVESTQGLFASDPFRMGLVDRMINPILHLRKIWTEMQVQTYEELIDYKRAQEMRLLYLKQARNGVRDESLEQDINFVEGEIERTHRDIQKWEDQYA
jgi:hypothetical protein